MILIDTHAHLYAEEFKEDINDVILRAEKAGLVNICLPNIDSSSTKGLLELLQDKPVFFIPMMGLHPCSVSLETYHQELEHVKIELDKGGYKAIGEIGMDLYWDKSTKAIQAEAFVQQCHWAVAMDLPIAIHSRNATNELLEIIQKLALPSLRGVFHCFGDGVKEAEEIIDLGFYLGIGGVLTFKNSGLAEVLSSIDLKHMVLETDSPYLAPVPHRGKRNESSYLKLIAEKLAEVKNMELEQIAEITTLNARELFRIT